MHPWHDCYLDERSVERGFPAEIDGQPVGGRGHAIYTAFVNMSGCAGLNIPCGHTREGLPVGMQLVAAPGQDGALLAMAHECEESGLWHIAQPTQMPGLLAG